MKKLLALMLLAGVALGAAAVEYRTVDAATVLYDAPSQRGNKLFVIRRDTPVELIVTLEGWVKVREPEGALAWIESKFLSERRTVFVSAGRAEIRKSAEDSAPLVFEAEKSVSLDYQETVPGGWVKVRHRDGQGGFVRANQVWGY